MTKGKTHQQRVEPNDEGVKLNNERVGSNGKGWYGEQSGPAALLASLFKNYILRTYAQSPFA